MMALCILATSVARLDEPGQEVRAVHVEACLTGTIAEKTPLQRALSGSEGAEPLVSISFDCWTRTSDPLVNRRWG
jgi:hypothetical protein